MAKSEKDKFSELYSNFYPLVFSAVYTKIGDTDETKDICQEIFIVFYNKMDEIENPRKWLYGTIRNFVLQYYQKKNPEKEDLEGFVEDIGMTFVNGFRDTRIIIKQSIEEIKCDETERMILDLIASHNFTYQNVAAITNLTRRQVEYKYGQIVKRIQESLKEKGIKNIEDLL